MSIAKVITAFEAAQLIKTGMTVMIGGFMTNGTAETVIQAVAESNVSDLTVICNDAGYDGVGSGRLIRQNKVKKLITSHIGLNKECGRRYLDGRLEVVLQPQGTLAEQIRAAGAGLGGVLTRTGLGTVVAEGKKVIEIDGTEYLLEKPLHADVAVIQGFLADEAGNLRYRGTMRNFNILMATAADTVIAEVEKIVPNGDIGAEYVETPAMFIDYLVKNERAQKGLRGV